MSILAQLASEPSAWDQPWSFWILLAIGAAGLVAVLFRSDDRIEVRRRAAIRGATQLHGIGLTRAAAICEAYAVGDYSGAVREARRLASRARQIGGADAIAAAVVLKSLPGLLKDPVHGPQVQALLAGLEQPTSPQAAPAAKASSTPSLPG